MASSDERQSSQGSTAAQRSQAPASTSVGDNVLVTVFASSLVQTAYSTLRKLLRRIVACCNAPLGMAPLPWIQKASYSVGHVLNDLCAACWFSYMLLYLQNVQGLSGTEAGAVLFSGQLADAIATPLVGIGSDATKVGLPSLGLGRRKIWNAGGVIVVACSFFFIFGVCLACVVAPHGAVVSSVTKTATFSTFAALFNVGWAAVQVSHMAMVPEITTDEGERVLLNSSRYAFTVLSNLVVFLTFLGLLAEDGGDEAKYESIVYTRLALVVLSVGGACSLIFLAGTRERSGRKAGYTPLLGVETELADRHGSGSGSGIDGTAGAAGENKDRLTIDANHANEARRKADSDTDELLDGYQGGSGAAAEEVPPSPRLDLGSYRAKAARRSNSRATEDEDGSMTPHLSRRKNHMRWSDWLTVVPFYQVMVVYATVRLAVNVSQVYLSFYITDTLDMQPQALATVPLLSYIAQLVATLSMKRVAMQLGRRRTLTLGALTTAAACAAMLVLSPSTSGALYPASIVLGLGCACAMVVSVSLEGDLVGPNTESGAFVYGAMSFADKLLNGIVVLSIQYVADKQAPPGSASRAEFIRLVTGLVPGVSAVVAAVVGWTIMFPPSLQGSGFFVAAPPSTAAAEPANDEHSSVIQSARKLLPKNGAGAAGEPALARGVSFYSGGVGGAGRPGLSRGWSVLNAAANAVVADEGHLPGGNY